MHLFRDRRPAWLALSGAAAILAGCANGAFGPQGGGVGAFNVVSASPERAVVSARGRKVAVAPMAGFCVAEDSIETSARSAFVLIGGCALQGDEDKAPDANGRLHLPSTMPGVTTVSISGAPGFGRDGVSARDLFGLETYLESPEGRELLGRGSTDSQVSVIRTQREGDALYMLVEDKSAQEVPLFAPRFWRAFVVLNDRLTVVTVNGFREAPMNEDDMLRHLDAQVQQLQMANATVIDEAPIQVAATSTSPEPGLGAGMATPATAADADDADAGDENFSSTGGSAMEQARAEARARREKAEWAAAAREASPLSATLPATETETPSATEVETPSAAETEGQMDKDGADMNRPAPRPAGESSSAAPPPRSTDAEATGAEAAGADAPMPAPRAGDEDGFNAPVPPERTPN